MEPVACSVRVGDARVEFEVWVLERTESIQETCLILSTDKFAPVNGYSIVDASKSICLFTRASRVYHNTIPRDEFVPLLTPLSDYKMFQIELATGTEFKFGVDGHIYCCVVIDTQSPKLTIEGNVAPGDIFDQFEALHRKIPHLIPQRPQISRCRSLTNIPAPIAISSSQQHHIAKTPSRDSIYDKTHGPFVTPISNNEYDVDRIFIRAVDPITKNVIWKLRDIDAGRLLIKFSQKESTYKPGPHIFNVVVSLCKRNGTQHSQTYLAPEALKLGISIDVKDVINIKITHAGRDLVPKSVVVLDHGTN